ncbi:hypothetical protein [Moorella sp. Hama-1]|uniref:hypothetical protein n=1 Tax=Moorella sp. Hama-1 TaxID=2138101 RepID=UPI0012902CFE|nr:hypothetical protein [Moorella sp. Hama-1]BCV22904.1 hypothetical protein hamaS1_29730 [Moorella sp. Hama-1]
MSAMREELEKIIHRLQAKQLKLLLAYARELEDDKLTPEDIADIEGGKAEIARGEWVDWDELKRELNL